MRDKYFHSVALIEERCEGCTHCLRECPTQAIRIRGGKSHTLDEKCVDCGKCITVCPYQARVARTNSLSDFKKFKYVIALVPPVLYGQFGREVSPQHILWALKKVGFDEAYDLAPSSELFGKAIKRYLERTPPKKPILTAVCPTIVRLIQVKFPEFTELIIPIEPPREIGAKQIKEKKAKELGLKKEEIAVIYLAPCPGKMTAIKQPATRDKSNLDGAISIADLYNPLLSHILAIKEGEGNSKDQKFSGIGIRWAIIGGEARSVGIENSLAVAGIDNVVKVLEDIEKGKLTKVDYVECRACLEGCVGGPLAVENCYVARNKIANLLRIFKEEGHFDLKELDRLLEKGYFSFRKRLLPRPSLLLDKDPSRAIEKMREIEEISRGLPGIDCGACGSPTCRALAQDIVQGEAKLTDCVFKLGEKVKELAQETVKWAEKRPSSLA